MAHSSPHSRLHPHAQLSINPSPRTVSITMEDYIADDKDEHQLNMDMVHDFGADGMGVDMRDFTSDHQNEIDDRSLLGHHVDNPSLTHHSPTPPHPSTSAANLPNHPSSSGMQAIDMFQTETGLEGGDDEEDDGELGELSTGAKRRRGEGTAFEVEKDNPSRRKIKIEYIGDKSRRHITFSKRKAGIMKKAYELSILTGTQVLLLVVSETGLVYTFTTSKLQPLVQKAEGKSLIQACLNAPDGYGPDGERLSGPVPATNSKKGGLAIRPHKLTAEASAAMAASQAASASQSQIQHHHQLQAQAQAQAHLQAQHHQQQLDSTTSLGRGSISSPTNRPKKRLPSSKRRQASTSAPNSSDPGSGDLPNIEIPPVPPMPDMHRPQTPHSQHSRIVEPTLQSPLSAGFHIPPEYRQPHYYPHPPPEAGYYYPPTPNSHPVAPPGVHSQMHHQGASHPHQGAPGSNEDQGGPYVIGMFQERGERERLMKICSVINL
ncbi:uncharacterized protein L203_100836 [Cryptococcus depauperatus CBS 7841]|uniref:MADS-box domain-containing protein n=1 Tax=Cryptococcus depauperatus CBS 7841 TaxID=1295531 RepID=A0AAJ8JNQ7_9TREE